MATIGLTPIKQRPLTGLLDMRSSPEDMPSASFRFKSNLQVTEQSILKRRAGWRKFLSGRFATDTEDGCFCPSNFDLHDQLLPLQTFQDVLPDGSCSPTIQTRDQGREHVTTLFEAETQSGDRKLFAGTFSRIYALNEPSGNWKLIADGYGGSIPTGVPARRWRHAQLQDTILFTNDYDKILHHEMGQPKIGCAQQAVAEIPELESLSIGGAKVIASYNGVILIMNIVEGGQRFASRIRWCGLNQPLRWNTPDPETVAGFLDLDYTETILGALELRGSIFIYTDKSIWRFSTTGGTAVFGAVKIYTEKRNLEGCLAYPNTLISTGDSHFYMGRDGIYEMNPFMTRPKRVEWIHRSAYLLFDHPTTKVDTTCCEQVVAGYSPIRKEIWFSWPSLGANCIPNNTLILNVKYTSSDYVDHGFTAFANYRPDNQQSLVDWMLEYCVCEVSDVLEFYDKEGLPSALCDKPCTQLFTPNSLYTSNSLEHDANIVDYTQSRPDSDSLCGLLGDKRIEDFCEKCESEQLFIGVSVTDKCIKEIGENFSRERCANSETGMGETLSAGYCSFEGSYAFDGYYSVLRGTLQVGSDDYDKMIRRFTAAITTALEPNPPSLKLRVGVSHQPLDPNPADPFSISGNSGDCEVTWYPQDLILLDCPAKKSAVEQVAEKLRSVRKFMWPLHRRGRFLHYELSVMDISNDVEFPPLGGDATFTSLTADVKLQKI